MTVNLHNLRSTYEAILNGPTLVSEEYRGLIMHEAFYDQGDPVLDLILEDPTDVDHDTLQEYMDNFEGHTSREGLDELEKAVIHMANYATLRPHIAAVVYREIQSLDRRERVLEMLVPGDNDVVCIQALLYYLHRV